MVCNPCKRGDHQACDQFWYDIPVYSQAPGREGALIAVDRMPRENPVETACFCQHKTPTPEESNDPDTAEPNRTG